jgi:NADH-quinone oxidoreductase subunit H
VEFIAQHPVLVVSLVKIVVLMVVLMTVLAYLSWFERKVIAHIQSRWGPYYVGAHGLLQPLADGVKFLFKEDLTPPASDKLVYVLAPFLALTLAMTTLALIPFGPATVYIFGHPTQLAVANVDIGLLALFAITSMGVYGVALAGWSSNSKYPLLGGLRSSAQMISYEVSLTVSVIGVMLLAGSFNFNEIIERQRGPYSNYQPMGGFWHWNFIPQIVGLLCYATAAVAETNRAPFDLPEGETELVGGFHTEYSSFKFAMFFMAEYANMVTVACLATILFLGGWLSPFPERWTFMQYLPGAALILTAVYLAYDVAVHMRGIARMQLAVVALLALGIGALCLLPAVMPVIQGPFWFVTKVTFVLFVYVWIRGTLPRFRYDQLMAFGWKLLLPVSLANLVITALWIVRHELLQMLGARG